MDLKLFLAFLFFPVSCLLAQEHNQSHPISCPKDFHCGKLGRLRFPFTNISEHDCGLCMVKCDNLSSPKIQLDWSSDQIFDAVSVVSNSNIKLRDLQLQLLLNEKSCNTFYYEIYLPNFSSVSFKIASNTTTLFRCSHFPYLSQEIIAGFYSNGYENDTSCDGIQLFYRNPKYSPSRPERSPRSCMALNLPMRPWENFSNESKLFEMLSFEFDLEWQLNPKDGQGKRKLEIIKIAVPAVGGTFLLVILIFLCRSYKISIWKQKTCKNQDLEIFFKNCGSLASKRYHYSYLKKITNSFSIRLGQGGYGSVYKGTMQDGSLVAVKVLKESKGNGEEFINEVASISRTSHVNIVTLLGFCFEGQKRALIYEFMANGSLEKFIYEEKSLLNRQLEWPTLFRIAVGIARGLEYLHNGCNTRILHFDIKPHNILLDENFCPKISDFGLAKLCTRKESMISTMDARGTIGYIAPEVVCKNIGGVSHKSDVYSYGMMVLEMVGGRKNVNVEVDHTSEIYFPHWIYSKLRHAEELGLSGILNEEENEQARKMLIVSLWCIQTNPSSRPTITNVHEMLQGPLEVLGMPPKPYLYSPSGTSPERLT